MSQTMCVWSSTGLLKNNSHEQSSKEPGTVKGVYEYPVWSPVSTGPRVDLFHYRTEQQAKQTRLFEKKPTLT